MTRGGFGAVIFAVRLVSLLAMPRGMRDLPLLFMSATLIVLPMGCASTQRHSQGTYEQLLTSSVVSDQAVGEDLGVEYEVASQRLHLKVHFRKMCARQVRQEFQVVERVEHSARPDWWVVPVLGLVASVVGTTMLALAPSRPTTGTDSEGKPNNPRQDFYILGGLLLGGGGLAMLDFPLVGEREEVRKRDQRMVSETVVCGSRPYVGPLTITRAGRSLQARVGPSGSAIIDVGFLLGGDDAVPFVVSFEDLDVQKEVRFDRQEMESRSAK